MQRRGIKENFFKLKAFLKEKNKREEKRKNPRRPVSEAMRR
jgi:hypothetical protein